MCVRGWSAANAVSVMHSPPFTSAVPAAVGETTGSRVPSPIVAPARWPPSNDASLSACKNSRAASADGGSVSFASTASSA